MGGAVRSRPTMRRLPGRSGRTARDSVRAAPRSRSRTAEFLISRVVRSTFDSGLWIKPVNSVMGQGAILGRRMTHRRSRRRNTKAGMNERMGAVTPEAVAPWSVKAE